MCNPGNQLFLLCILLNGKVVYHLAPTCESFIRTAEKAGIWRSKSPVWDKSILSNETMPLIYCVAVVIVVILIWQQECLICTRCRYYCGNQFVYVGMHTCTQGVRYSDKQIISIFLLSRRCCSTPQSGTMFSNHLLLMTLTLLTVATVSSKLA